MVFHDPVVRRLAPGLFAILVGVMVGWMVMRSMPDIDAADERALFTVTVVLSVLSALLLDVSLDRVARALQMPRTWVVPAFVSALLLAAAGPLLLYGLHAGVIVISEAALFWVVLLATLATYLFVGIVAGRLARVR